VGKSTTSCWPPWQGPRLLASPIPAARRRQAATRSPRYLIPRSIRWLITKATTATGSTRNGAPPLYHALGQHPLTAAQWIPILVSPWLLLLAEEARKLIIRRHASP
jgi:hypothetical protein